MIILFQKIIEGGTMNETKNQPFTILASMLIINSNYVPGKLFIKNDGVYFKGNGQLENNEIRSQFLFDDIKHIKFGFSFKPYRIVIQTYSDSQYLFDFVPKQEGKVFVQTVKQNL
ncbi:hypothetical protein BU650_07065 [Staphylococcus chromogenes]|nr:hypothetical protein [Staphylococcus chromogenes]PTG85273.1 hypothetical protein BU650_07065 [Staphylococcus chromogenes]